jgi:uncharacterized membrane protein
VTWRRVLGDTTARVLGSAYVALAAVGFVFAHLARPAMPWLGPNLVLASVPPLAAALLFGTRRRGSGWWVAAALTLVALPNTPYVLTDIIHFGEDRRIAAAAGMAPWAVPAAYLVVVGAGVCGYAYVLARLLADVRRAHGRPLAAIAAIAVNGLCAAGVWLGRVERLNSWDVARPHIVVAALGQAASVRALAEMTVVFVGAGTAAAVLLLAASATRSTHRHSG